MKKDLGNVFRELKDDVASFAELKFELLKLNTYERIGKVIAILSYGLLLSSLILVMLLFAMLTLGFLFSHLLNSTTAGFSIVVALYLVLVIIVFIQKNRIRLNVMNIIVSALVSMDKKKDVTSTTEAEVAQTGHGNDSGQKPDENE